MMIGSGERSESDWVEVADESGTPMPTPAPSAEPNAFQAQCKAIVNDDLSMFEPAKQETIEVGYTPSGLCGCRMCIRSRTGGAAILRSRMVVCEHCGNKRCPHAENHCCQCTGSNEPEQTSEPASAGEKVEPGAIDTPWPARDVVAKLVEAADILLDDKNYDGHGWETIHQARQVAREFLGENCFFCGSSDKDHARDGSCLSEPAPPADANKGAEGERWVRDKRNGKVVLWSNANIIYPEQWEDCHRDGTPLTSAGAGTEAQTGQAGQ